MAARALLAFLALGAIALLVPGRRPASWAAAVCALAGLAWTLGAPHLVIGHRAQGEPGAGAALTPWVGAGQLLLVAGHLGALAFALIDRLLPDPLESWPAGDGTIRWAVAVLVVTQERPVRTTPRLGLGGVDAVAGRGAEDARPPREQPRHVRGDEVLVVSGVGERVPLAREVERNLGKGGTRGGGGIGGGHNTRR